MSNFDDDYEVNPEDETGDDQFELPQDALAELIHAYEERGFDLDYDHALGMTAHEVDDLRGVVFSTADEALDYLEQFGAEAWADIVWLDDDVWGVFVPESSE